MSEKGFTLIELLIVVAIIGIIAAVAIPSLLRARVSANETAMIGDIRTVIEAEATYHASNGGNYGVITCLSTPSGGGCIPNYPATAPTMLDSQLTQLGVKSGYDRSMNYIGTGPSAGDRQSFCIQGQPAALNRTGTRTLASDSAGALAGSYGVLACCSAGIVDTAVCPLLR